MPAPAARHIELLIPLAGAPTNTGAPVISGTRVVGQTLSTTDGTWNGSPTSFAYQWKRDGTNIGGATSNTYLLVTADANTVVTCAVTATSSHGTSTPATSNGLFIVPEIISTDIQFWTSAGSGLGGSPGAIIPSPASVFDSVTHPEAQAGDIEYRAVYLVNTHTVRSLSGTVLWIESQTTSLTTDIAIGIAPEPAGSDVTAITNEQTPPTGVSFTSPPSQGSGLAVGTLGPGQGRGVWLRWTVLPGTDELPADSCTLEWDGTPA